MSSAIQVLFLGVVVAVFAILLGGLTDLSIGVIAIFALGVVVFFAFLAKDGKHGQRG